MTAKQISQTNLLKPALTGPQTNADLNSKKSTDFFSRHLHARLETFSTDDNVRDIRSKQTEVNQRKENKNDYAERQDRPNSEVKRKDDHHEKRNDQDVKRSESKQDQDNGVKNQEKPSNDEHIENENENKSTSNNETTDGDDQSTNQEQANLTNPEAQSLTDETGQEIDALFSANTIVASEETATKQQNTLNTENTKQIADLKQTANSDKTVAAHINKQDLKLQNGGAANAALKFTAELESTLGTDTLADAENGEVAAQDQENLSQLMKLAGKNKETSNSFTLQNTNQNTSILNNNLAANPGLQLTQAAAKDFQPIQTATKELGDITGTITNNMDTKTSLTTNQIRSAAQSSPTQTIAVQIAQKAQNGIKQFDIRLNPPELGRVDVRLEFAKDGQINTHLIVERPETLDMLSKDARQLAKALSEAGINLENDGLSFSLKNQDESSEEQNDNSLTQNEQLDETGDETDITETIRNISLKDGLDISV